jgi:hypothetical protein
LLRRTKLKKTKRGSLSSDFKPVADKNLDQRVISPDLQSFRLATGVPIFVDFKSIPYKDGEVLQWRNHAAAVTALREHKFEERP